MRRRTSLRAVLATTALITGWAVAPPIPPAGAAPVVTATPATGLTDFQVIQVTGSGFEPNTIYEIFECRGGAVGDADCDGYNGFELDSDGAGNISFSFLVDARIYLPDGTEVDCRTDPAGCEIGVGYLLDADEWPEVALDFDPTAPLHPPVAGSVTPSTGLVDGQVVTVLGENLTDREESWAYLCAVGDGEIGSRCDLDQAARTQPEPDGTVEHALTVRSTFNPPLGGSVDCRTAPDGCEVALSWGFTGPVDRVAHLPVSFAAQVTTTTTVASSTTTTTAGAPTTPPATPVPAAATFTG